MNENEQLERSLNQTEKSLNQSETAITIIRALQVKLKASEKVVKFLRDVIRAGAKHLKNCGEPQVAEALLRDTEAFLEGLDKESHEAT